MFVVVPFGRHVFKYFAGTYFRGRPYLKNFAGTYFREFEQNRENRENLIQYCKVLFINDLT